MKKKELRRAWQEVSRADCVLMVIDSSSSTPSSELNEEIRRALPAAVPIIQVFNKIDVLNLAPKKEKDAVYLSAKLGQGLELLKEKIKEVVGYQSTEGQFLARRRHLHALDRAKELLLAGQLQLTEQRAGELLAEDLRLAHQALGEITGEFSCR